MLGQNKLKEQIGKALSGDSEALGMLKSFMLGGMERRTTKGLKDGGLLDRIGEPNQTIIRFFDLNTPNERTTIQVNGKKTNIPEEPMTMEEAKEVKGFIPENPFPEPKRKRIKAIQADAVQRGLPEPTKEQVREILFKQWKKTHPDIRDFEIHFDFEHEQMHFKSIAVDNSKEEKTI